MELREVPPLGRRTERLADSADQGQLLDGHRGPLEGFGDTLGAEGVGTFRRPLQRATGNQGGRCFCEGDAKAQPVGPLRPGERALRELHRLLPGVAAEALHQLLGERPGGPFLGHFLDQRLPVLGRLPRCLGGPLGAAGHAEGQPGRGIRHDVAGQASHREHPFGGLGKQQTQHILTVLLLLEGDAVPGRFENLSYVLVV